MPLIYSIGGREPCFTQLRMRPDTVHKGPVGGVGPGSFGFETSVILTADRRSNTVSPTKLASAAWNGHACFGASAHQRHRTRRGYRVGSWECAWWVSKKTRRGRAALGFHWNVSSVDGRPGDSTGPSARPTTVKSRTGRGANWNIGALPWTRQVLQAEMHQGTMTAPGNIVSQPTFAP
jgi:hypothetical protein